MIGKIFIQDLQVPFRVGVTEVEQQTFQNLNLDIVCHTDFDRVALTDSLEDVVDYKHLHHSITSLSRQRTFRMIETVAHEIAVVCMADSRIIKMEVRLTKTHRFIPCSAVGVEIIKQKITAV